MAAGPTTLLAAPTLRGGQVFVGLGLPIGIAGVVALPSSIHLGIALVLVAVLLVFVGIATIRSARWYGGATLTVAGALPPRPGDLLEGHVEIERGLSETLDVSLVLEALRPRSHGSRSEPPRAWHVRAPSVGRVQAGGRFRVPIRLEIPANVLPETPPHDWQLHLEASPREGPPLRVTFTLGRV